VDRRVPPEDEVRREQAIPKGRVEIGRQIIRGHETPIYATTEEEVTHWFGRKPDSPQFAEINRVLDIRTELYLDREDELVSLIREQTATRAEALRAAGVDDIEAKAEARIERASVLSAKIDDFTPEDDRGRARAVGVWRRPAR
jgi:hypothetical protein